MFALQNLSLAYYFKYHIGREKSVQLFNVVGSVALIVALPLSKPLAQRFGKKAAFIGSSLLSGASPAPMLPPTRAALYRILVTAVLTGVPLGLPPALAQGYFLDDAERFASLFLDSQGVPDADTLQRHYLDPGTAGVRIFTPYRIIDAVNLAGAVAEDPQTYRTAIQVCLPGARQVADEAARVLREIQTLLQQDEPAPIYFVFGAGNSGGTASAEALVLGLEVVCRSIESPAAAAESIKHYVAHEVVHVFQARAASAGEQEGTLLRQALGEGFADFIANQVLDEVGVAERARHEYGLLHESELWAEFSRDLGATTYQPWMYGPGEDGRPADLGYWIGKRIAEAYYEQAADKAGALQDLLRLNDPLALLEKSGYAARQSPTTSWSPR